MPFYTGRPDPNDFDGNLQHRLAYAQTPLPDEPDSKPDVKPAVGPKGTGSRNRFTSNNFTGESVQAVDLATRLFLRHHILISTDPFITRQSGEERIKAEFANHNSTPLSKPVLAMLLWRIPWNGEDGIVSQMEDSHRQNHQS
ncbi:hypothetical protein BT69DRAFT_765676 [Atractiella rhizophila]|nr:hypothetical protein BT69DRAFT_765676 [Atractiella rhizophila]